MNKQGYRALVECLKNKHGEGEILLSMVAKPGDGETFKCVNNKRNYGEAEQQ